MSSKKNGGSANKKMKKYVKLVDYLEAHHPKVYDLFNWLGMQGALTPKGGTGLTFLLPDAKLTAELHKLAESDEAEKATDMLYSLIVKDAYTDAKDWAEKQDDVPNLFGKSLKVKSVSGNKVVLDGGAELTLDTKAKFFSRQGRKKFSPIAVWDMKGSFDPEKLSDATYRHVSSDGAPKAKKGGRVRGGLATNRSKRLRAYVNKIKGDYVEAPALGENIMFREVARAINFFIERDYKDLLKKVYCLPHWCPEVTFFLLFDNEHYIGQKHIMELLDAIEGGSYDNKNVDNYTNFFAKHQFDEDAACWKKQDAVQAARRGVIDKALRKTDVKFYKRLASEVDSLCKTNKIGGVSNVWFKCVHDEFAKNPDLYEAMCEFKFFVGREFRLAKSLTGMPELQLQQIEAAFCLADAFNESTNVSRYATFTKPSKMPSLACELYSGPVAFARSCCFLCLPKAARHITGEGEFDAEEAEDVYSKEAVNDDALGLAEIEAQPQRDFELLFTCYVRAGGLQGKAWKTS